MNLCRLIIIALCFTVALGAQASDTAVVLIDMQPDFTDMVERKFREPLVASQVELLQWAKANGHSVLVFEYQGAGPTISPLAELVASFGSGRFAYVTKDTDGGFDGTLLPSTILNRWGVRKLIVAGVNGYHCVLSTVCGALDRHFEVYTAADVVADFSPSGRAARDIYPSRRWWQKLENFYPFTHQMSCQEFLGSQGS